MAFFVVVLSILSINLYPDRVYASVGSFFSGLFSASANELDDTNMDNQKNSQNMSLAEAVVMLPSSSNKSEDLTIVDDSAIETFSGPSGTALQVSEKEVSDIVSIYIVREGDNISTIAQMFNVSAKTILWANNIKDAKGIKAGMELVILPISGVKHIVKKGDTLKSIANRYKGDVDEIKDFNHINSDTELKVGAEVIIPDGEEPQVVTTTKNTNTKSSGSAPKVYSGMFIKPAAGIKTQGLHGKFSTAIDIGNKLGTPVYAAASGKVITARMGGWNGGYGNYIVIQHSNGLQSLYAHLNSIIVSAGQNVSQGDQIATMGSTGRSTGNHLHFEILGGARNWNPFN